MGMVYGIPFPDIYEWTWGEIQEYINCKLEHRRSQLKEDAAMYFTTASLIAKMVAGGKGQQFSISDEYKFLWTEKERQDLKVQAIYNKFKIAQ